MVTINRPRSREYVFPEYAELTRITDTRAIVTTPTTEREITGESVPMLEEVLSVLRGGGDLEAIRSETELDAAVADELLTYLEQERVIVRDEAQFSGDVFDWLVADPARTRAQLEEATVGVITPEDAAGIGSFLETLEQHVSLERYRTRAEIGAETDLLVSVAGNERPDWQEHLLEGAIDGGYAFLPGRLIGTTVRIGPLTRPNVTPCYHCFYARWLASSDVPAEARRALAERPMPNESASAPAYAYRQLENLLFREVLYALIDEKTATSEGSYVEYDVDTSQLQTTDVLKLPGCDSCGTN